MKCPSAADLIKNLKIDAAAAKLIRQIAKAAEDPDKLRRIIDARCPKTAAYVRGLYSDPYDSDMWCVTVALHAINDLAGGYGVEGLGRTRGPDYAPPYLMSSQLKAENNDKAGADADQKTYARLTGGR